ncbi:hypothetical protein O0L34_g10317 [Tuta absoluta]|nr:hypothetical protein O0L34_g14464 [Tuta absoluta]KAJ2941085.1 hypothetical protein O0L34_g10317 [Tuta absoluta]
MAEKDIQSLLDTQHRLEKSLLEKMQAFDDNLKQAVAAANKDTVAKLRTDFSSFKDIVFSVLDMLRNQISSLHNSIETMEQRQRRKCLIFNGVAEEGSKENTQELVINIINSQLELKTVTPGSFKACHRLGGLRQDGARPILVRFSEMSMKTAVWKSKTKLKGTKFSLAEFLTQMRQHIFIKARKHFGIKQCWSMDGNINVKLPDGKKCIVRSLDELGALVEKFPSPQPGIGAAGGRSKV